MASPRTLQLKRERAEKHAASLAAVAKELGLGPVHRKSHRWIGIRTKGLPYSRCKVEDIVQPASPGNAAVVRISHPTRKSRRVIIQLTPKMIDGLYPGLSINTDLTGALLGRF